MRQSPPSQKHPASTTLSFFKSVNTSKGFERRQRLRNFSIILPHHFDHIFFGFFSKLIPRGSRAFCEALRAHAVLWCAGRAFFYFLNPLEIYFGNCAVMHFVFGGKCCVLFYFFFYENYSISISTLPLRSWLLLTQWVQKGGFPCGQINQWKGSEKKKGVVVGFAGSVVLAHLKCSRYGCRWQDCPVIKFVLIPDFLNSEPFLFWGLLYWWLSFFWLFLKILNSERKALR